MAHSSKAPVLPMILTLLLTASVHVTAADSNGAKEILQEGITLFTNGLYDSALTSFRNLTLDKSADAVLKASGYFWLAKSYMALGKLDEAEKNLEFCLTTYPNAVDHSEALYQKGRLLFMQEEYENAIQELQGFLSSYPQSPFVGNAYFWVGESLYNLGRLDEATAVYAKIVRDYPASLKVETAQYRLSLINLMRREEELTKLLKWSHEDSLKNTEEYQQREKTYEQAITALQKRLASAGLAPDGKSPADAQSALAQKTAEADQLAAELQALKAQTAGQAVGASALPADLENQRKVLEATRKLLELKAEALALKEVYLRWIEGNGGGR
jgi:TolA-binding protein